jgi:hypothetical protein
MGQVSLLMPPDYAKVIGLESPISLIDNSTARNVLHQSLNCLIPLEYAKRAEKGILLVA